MLKDYGKRETRRTEEARRRWALKDEYAQEILRLFPWSWWVTITFRGSPAPSSWSGMTRIRMYLRDIRRAARGPIMAAIAEGRGENGRFHAHLLIAGVAHLSIGFWREDACRRFGSTELEIYDPSGNACRYVIQNALATGGELHLEGDLTRSGSGEQPKDLRQTRGSLR